jgi:hypothetical protein
MSCIETHFARAAHSVTVRGEGASVRSYPQFRPGFRKSRLAIAPGLARTSHERANVPLTELGPKRRSWPSYWADVPVGDGSASNGRVLSGWEGGGEGVAGPGWCEASPSYCQPANSVCPPPAALGTVLISALWRRLPFQRIPPFVMSCPAVALTLALAGNGHGWATFWGRERGW